MSAYSLSIEMDQGCLVHIDVSVPADVLKVLYSNRVKHIPVHLHHYCKVKNFFVQKSGIPEKHLR